jgi:hypothetical protein
MIFAPFSCHINPERLGLYIAHMQTQTVSTSQLITSKQLGVRWQVSQMTLRRWRGAGKITAHHLGRGIRFSVADIEKIEAESKA